MFGNKKIILLILGLSALTHFAFFGHPNQTVFDEVHFGKFISGYFTGEYFFDIHPPLGKLLISGMGYLTGFEPGFSFANIGETFPDRHYLWLRFLPALAGTLLPLIIFLLAKELNFSSRSSLLAALLVIFENTLTVQSRFILLDSFLLLFGFSSLLFYFKYRSRSPQGPTLRVDKWLILTGISAGLAASVKWTGLAFLGIILVLELINQVKLWSNKNRPEIEWTNQALFAKSAWFVHRGLSRLLPSFSCLILIPLAIYASIFSIHLSLLSKSGQGNAFMSPGFQKTLAGNSFQNNPEVKEIGFVQKFKELNKEMYRANQRLTATHPYSSQWYSWPLMSRPIFYWVKGQEKIYLLGNPFIWWAGSVAMVLLLTYSIKNLAQKPRTFGFVENFILLGFFINLLPFIGIGRVMFLYHYFSSLIFSILALAYFGNKKSVFAFLTIVSTVGFLYFTPLTYGLPILPQHEANFFWLPSWR